MRDRNEAALGAAFSLMFKLRRSEGQVLAKLTTGDYCTKEELHAAVNHNPIVAPSTMSALICVLRKKLALHKLRITTIPGLGYGLDKNTRDKIRKALARYDEGLIPTTSVSHAGHNRAKAAAKFDQAHT